jgi:hypothetical protein
MPPSAGNLNFTKTPLTGVKSCEIGYPNKKEEYEKEDKHLYNSPRLVPPSIPYRKLFRRIVYYQHRG